MGSGVMMCEVSPGVYTNVKGNPDGTLKVSGGAEGPGTGGEVTLAPNTQVGLKDGTQVGLKPGSQVVASDPAVTVSEVVKVDLVANQVSTLALPAGYRYSVNVWHGSSANTVYGMGTSAGTAPAGTIADMYQLDPVSTVAGTPKRSQIWIDGVHAQQVLKFVCSANQSIYWQVTTA